MTEREADEAELALLAFVDLMRAYNISVDQALLYVMVKVAAMYSDAYETEALVH